MAKVIYNPVGFSQGSHLDGTRYGGGTVLKTKVLKGLLFTCF